MGSKLVQHFLEDNLAVSIKFKMFVQFDLTIIFLGFLEIFTYLQGECLRGHLLKYCFE